MLPDFIPKEAWEAYLLMRKQMGKKHQATEYAQKLLINKLTVWKAEGHNIELIINQSIERSWVGLFPVQAIRVDKQGGGNGPTPVDAVAATKAKIAEFDRPVVRSESSYEAFKRVKSTLKH